MSKKSIFLLLSILVTCFIELWLLSFGKKQFGVIWSPLIVFISGLFSGVGFLIFFYRKELIQPEKKIDWKKLFLGLVLTVGGIWKCGDIFRNLIKNNPVIYDETTNSDIIPQLYVLVDRFLSGEFPYQLITDWPLKHYLFPTYLPLTWMPFVIPEILNFDYRWIAFAVLFLSFLYFFKKNINWDFQWMKIAFLTILPFLFLYAFQVKDGSSTFIYSIEPLIAGYYLFLAAALFSSSNLVRGGALTLCLLSRYSIILWIPLFFFVIFFKEKKSNFFQIGGFLFASFLLIYAIPFLSEDPSIFMKGYEYHSKAAPQAWNTFPWQAEGELPGMMTGGVGLGIYMHLFYDGSPSERLSVFKILHLVMCCLTVLISMLVFLKIKDRIDYRVFLLGTLKIYLVMFYNFIQMPFQYLFLPLVFISLPMIGLLISQVELKKRHYRISFNHKK